MNKENLIKKIKQMSWDVWMYRDYDFLAPYLMVVNATKQAYKTQGIKGEFPVIVYDSYYWYINKKLYQAALKSGSEYLKKVDIFTLSKQCELLYKRAKKKINELAGLKSDNPITQYEEILRLVAPLNVYVWVAHQAEFYYENLLRQRLKHVVKKQAVDKFIGDVSFPLKKNAHHLLERDVRRGVNLKELRKRYAWMKARTKAGFADGYSMKEMRELRKEILRKKPEHKRSAKLPVSLEKLVSEVQEAVYLRTFRSDALYELYYLAKPIFRKVENYLKIEGVQHYLPAEIIKGKITQRYTKYALVKYYNDIFISRPFIKRIYGPDTELNGVVVWPGKATGIVKVVHNTKDIKKVKQGDILVTHMTIPAYILAMNKAAALVTDEGGLTCHAAIIARELKKPCIINTKKASKVLKDGNLVEVDATKGKVRKL